MILASSSTSDVNRFNTFNLASRIRARSWYHLAKPIISSGAGFLIAPAHNRSEPRDAQEKSPSRQVQKRTVALSPNTQGAAHRGHQHPVYPTSAQCPVRKITLGFGSGSGTVHRPGHDFPYATCGGDVDIGLGRVRSPIPTVSHARKRHNVYREGVSGEEVQS